MLRWTCSITWAPRVANGSRIVWWIQDWSILMYLIYFIFLCNAFFLNKVWLKQIHYVFKNTGYLSFSSGGSLNIYITYQCIYWALYLVLGRIYPIDMQHTVLLFLSCCYGFLTSLSRQVLHLINLAPLPWEQLYQYSDSEQISKHMGFVKFAIVIYRFVHSW